MCSIAQLCDKLLVTAQRAVTPVPSTNKKTMPDSATGPDHPSASPRYCLGLWQHGGFDFAWVAEKQGDRFQQHLSMRTKEGQAVRLFGTVEGDAETRWPPSPPVQDLSLEKAGPSHFFLAGVGMAGDSHWSISVSRAELEPTSGLLEEPIDLPGAAVGLDFDVACRVKQSPVWLGSTYSFPGAIGNWQQAAHGRQEWADAEETAAVDRPSGTGPQGLGWCWTLLPIVGQPTARWEHAAGRLACVVPPGRSSSATTVRWKYRLLLDFSRLDNRM